MWQRIEYIVWKNDQEAHKKKFRGCLAEILDVTLEIYYKLPHLPVLEELRGKGFCEVDYCYGHVKVLDEWDIAKSCYPYGHYWVLTWRGHINLDQLPCNQENS